jgi:hypothetical protein
VDNVETENRHEVRGWDEIDKKLFADWEKERKGK